MNTLLDIQDERARHIEALEALLEEVAGDITDPAAEAAVDAWLRESDAKLHDKLDAYAAVIQEREYRAGVRKAEAERYGGMAQVDLNTAKRLRDRLRWFFEAHDLHKIETDRFRFTLANNGKAPVVLSVDPTHLPEWARRVTVEANKTAIRERLDRGEELPFASIGEKGRTLRIA